MVFSRVRWIELEWDFFQPLVWSLYVGVLSVDEKVGSLHLWSGSRLLLQSTVYAPNDTEPSWSSWQLSRKRHLIGTPSSCDFRFRKAMTVAPGELWLVQNCRNCSVKPWKVAYRWLQEHTGKPPGGLCRDAGEESPFNSWTWDLRGTMWGLFCPQYSGPWVVYTTAPHVFCGLREGIWLCCSGYLVRGVSGFITASSPVSRQMEPNLSLVYFAGASHICTRWELDSTLAALCHGFSS